MKHLTAAAALMGIAVLALGAWAADEWKPHSMERPRPPVRDPGAPSEKEFAPPPADALVLFDGKDLSQWVRRPGAKDKDKSPEPKWKVTKEYFEILPYGGDIVTKEKFGDCQIHIEWATPEKVDPTKKGQGRGNSGVFLPGHQELQVLDSYQNDTYPDGQAAAIYGKYPPLVNVCRKPGEWQSYDIKLVQPRYDAQKKLVKPCTLTVIHNGVLVQDKVDLGGGATEGPLALQDHHNTGHYRNIWIRKLTADETK